MKYHFNLYIDKTSPEYVDFSVFANGAKCGILCMTTDEYTKFVIALTSGAARHSLIEADAQTATGDPGILEAA
ncbi:MAG: hypothetical protein PVJ86_03985 [Phycisphaerales bacterium]|jgi:hypothetical protein